MVMKLMITSLMALYLLAAISCSQQKPIHDIGTVTVVDEKDTLRTEDSKPVKGILHTSCAGGEEQLLPHESPPPGTEGIFRTDFTRHTVHYDEILSGGPSKDGIPAIDEPKYETVVEGDVWLEEKEPVVVIEMNGQARAYPLQILTWHEIVNDVIGDTPVMVTFCPLCNTAIAYERRFDGQVLDFGTTGRLRYSNLIMYDRQTETWWQQALGNAIAGKYAGQCLTFVPATIISWKEFMEEFPGGSVLSRKTGYRRAYGQNPYAGYDDISKSPFLYEGPPTDGRLLPMERVLAVELDGETVAYPYTLMQKQHVVNDEVIDEPVTVFWAPGTTSALDDESIADSRDIGTAAAYSRVIDGEVLMFEYREGEIRDTKTGSKWNILGLAEQGDFAGKRLTPIVGVNHFWFSWSVFRPDTQVYGP